MKVIHRKYRLFIVSFQPVYCVIVRFCQIFVTNSSNFLYDTINRWLKLYFCKTNTKIKIV